MTTKTMYTGPLDREGTSIAKLLKGLGIRSRDDLARFDKRNGPKGIAGIGPVRMTKLRNALKSESAWAHLFGDLLPWVTPIDDRQPVSEIVYHDCGLALERYRMQVGKWAHDEATLYYPLNPKTGKPYEVPTDYIRQCPLCGGYLSAGSVDVVAPDLPPEQTPPVEPIEGELTDEGKAEAQGVQASGGGSGKPGKVE